MGLTVNDILRYNAIALTIILIPLLGYLLYLALRDRFVGYKKRVRKYSTYYNKLLQINEEYHFFALESQYIRYIRVDSSRKCDTFDFRNYFRSVILNEDTFLIDIAKKSRSNNNMYSLYSEDILPILHHETDCDTANRAHVPYRHFLRIEKRLIDEYILHPVISPHFVFTVVYDSPKGRSHNERSCSFSIDDYFTLRKEAFSRMEKMHSAQYQQRVERGKMTPSMRYDVLKRDGFRCVLCGKNTNDGIKLHVDHILPIAKGGKTEFSNLRTLCNICNSGKSAKYDPYGFK